MLLNLVANVTLFRFLFELDVRLAEQCRLGGCPYCGGLLHLASYPRKPRGGPSGLPEEYCRRLSYCCSREGCRRRTLPPSCLFMGRRIYLRAVIVVTCYLRQQAPPAALLRELCEAFGFSPRTVRRWLEWFASRYPSSSSWQKLRGRVDALVDSARLPLTLLQRFIDTTRDAQEALVACLRFLAIGDNQ